MPEGKHDTTALLDVDNTLVSGNVTPQELHINEALVKMLVAAGITQAWLFTDMRTTAHSVAEREVVIDAIQQLGMTVLGVSTPCDYAGGLSDEKRQERLPPPDQKTGRGQPALSSEWPEVGTLPPLPPAEPGIAYAEVKQILVANESVADLKTEKEKITFFRGLGDGTTSLSNSGDLNGLHKKAGECREIAGREAKAYGTGVKGRMYDQIVTHYLEKNPTEQPRRLLFIDDKAKELRTVRESHNAINTPKPLPWELHTLPLYQLAEHRKGRTSYYSLTPETRTVFSNQLTGLMAWLHMPWFPYLSVSVDYDSLHDDAKRNNKGLNALVQAIQSDQTTLPANSQVNVTSQVPTASTESQTQTLTISFLTAPNYELLDKLQTEKASDLTTGVEVTIVPVNKGLIASLSLFLLGGGTAATLSVALFAASKHFSNQAREWVTHLIGEQAFPYVLPTAAALAGVGLLGLLYCAYRHCKLKTLKSSVETGIEPSTLII